MRPLVSIIIAAYNYARYLPRCIDSILNQTYDNLEILLVNDGSTDNTEEVLAPYLEKECFKYIKQKNSGQPVARNNGIQQSSGDFIAFLDADDYWMADKLEKQLRLFSKDQELGVVYTLATWVDENDKPRKINAPKPQSGWVTNHLIVDNFVPFSSALVKKECFKKAGVFDEDLDMGIDWDIWLRISKYYKFAFVEEHLISYRVGHPGQMSKKQIKRQQQSDFILERFLKQNPGLVPKRALRKAQAYTFRNRGDYYARIDKKKSLQYNFKSLALNPFQPRIYARILRSLLKPAPTITTKS